MSTHTDTWMHAHAHQEHWKHFCFHPAIMVIASVSESVWMPLFFWGGGYEGGTIGVFGGVCVAPIEVTCRENLALCPLFCACQAGFMVARQWLGQHADMHVSNAPLVHSVLLSNVCTCCRYVHAYMKEGVRGVCYSSVANPTAITVAPVLTPNVYCLWSLAHVRGSTAAVPVKRYALWDSVHDQACPGSPS